MRLFTFFFVFVSFLFTSVPAMSASPSVCDQYAKEAITQLQQALSLGLPTPFPVWSDNYQHHYNWCLGQSENALSQGKALRQAQLDKVKPVKQATPSPAVIDSTIQAVPVQMPNLAKILAAGQQNNLVSQLQVSSGKALVVQATGQGTAVYGDRDFKYLSLPAVVAAGSNIATANDDKFIPEETPYIRFRLARPATVYVAYDSRYPQQPVWLRAFQPTGAKVMYGVGNSDLSLSLYSKSFPAGEVQLGGNLARGARENFGMYTVFVVEAKTSSPVVGGAMAVPAQPQAKYPVQGAVASAGQQKVFELQPSRNGAGQVFIPLLMYYLERQLVEVNNAGEIDHDIAKLMQESSENRDFYLRLLQKYKAMPNTSKQLMFDHQILQLTSSPYNTIQLDDIDQAYQRATTAPALSAIATQKNPLPPKEPTRLVSVNSSGSSIDQQGGYSDPSLGIFLQWRWDWPTKPEGFAIYRRQASQLEFQFLTEVSADTLTFRDSPLPVPAGENDSYCYEVRAFVRPVLSVSWQANRIESTASNSSCSNYGPNYQPLTDTDQDGMPDLFDWCPADGYAANIRRINGCPDMDEDGLVDFVQDQTIPKKFRDNCPPGSSDDGYGPHGPEWDHLRSIDPLPGCPVKYQLRWMGLQILNDPVDCTDPNASYKMGCDSETGLGNEHNQQNEVINGQTLPPGYEPYLVFGLLNGISPQGMAQKWTKKWCCGEGVNVGTVIARNFPPLTAPAGGIEPDGDYLGAESYGVDQEVLQKGMILLPEDFNVYVTIDELGLALTSTLYERDFDTQYTPERSEANIMDFLKKGVGVMQKIYGCSSTAGLGCAKALGQEVASLITFGMAGNDNPDPVTAKDPDDVMGATSTGFTSMRAAEATKTSGAYGFYQEIPYGSYFTSYTKGGLTKAPPLDAHTVATMVGRAKFCLIRKGIDESNVKQLCEPYATPEQWSKVLE